MFVDISLHETGQHAAAIIWRTRPSDCNPVGTFWNTECERSIRDALDSNRRRCDVLTVLIHNLDTVLATLVWCDAVDD